MILRSSYSDEAAINAFLDKIFGYGQTQVIWRRGRYVITLPRNLTQQEIDDLYDAVEVDHFKADSDTPSASKQQPTNPEKTPHQRT